MKKELKFFDEEHVGGLDFGKMIERLLEIQKEKGKPHFHLMYITATPKDKKNKKNKEKV